MTSTTYESRVVPTVLSYIKRARTNKDAGREYRYIADPTTEVRSVIRRILQNKDDLYYHRELDEPDSDIIHLTPEGNKMFLKSISGMGYKIVKDNVPSPRYYTLFKKSKEERLCHAFTHIENGIAMKFEVEDHGLDYLVGRMLQRNAARKEGKNIIMDNAGLGMLMKELLQEKKYVVSHDENEDDTFALVRKPFDENDIQKAFQDLEIEFNPSFLEKLIKSYERKLRVPRTKQEIRDWFDTALWCRYKLDAEDNSLN